MDNRDAEESNRRLWNELTPVHYRVYPVKEFLAGKTTLKPVELAEMGDVTGKSLLHLQCHFGLDTLSWARAGATVTGADISDESIRHAEQLKLQAGIRARFIRSNVYDLPGILQEQFDVVYTSIGVLPWLRDLPAWARIVHRFLKPGGFFYIYEAHPFTWTLDDENPGELRIRYPYFHSDRPTRYEGGSPDYADPEHRSTNPSYEWTWPLANVIGSLLDAGLDLRFLHEHPTMPYPAVPAMVKTEDDMWHHPDHEGMLPLAFSLKATRPRTD